MTAPGRDLSAAPQAVYRWRLTVPASALDHNHHVNNVVYLSWVQEAATRHADAAGCTAATRAAGALWVVREHRLRYLRPAFAAGFPSSSTMSAVKS